MTFSLKTKIECSPLFISICNQVSLDLYPEIPATTSNEHPREGGKKTLNHFRRSERENNRSKWGRERELLSKNDKKDCWGEQKGDTLAKIGCVSALRMSTLSGSSKEWGERRVEAIKDSVGLQSDQSERWSHTYPDICTNISATPHCHRPGPQGEQKRYRLHYRRAFRHTRIPNRACACVKTVHSFLLELH